MENYLYFILIICILGLLFNQSNIIVLLLILEVLFLIIMLLFILVPQFTNNLIFSYMVCLFVLSNISVKAAISLSILIRFYKLKGSINIKFYSYLKG